MRQPRIMTTSPKTDRTGSGLIVAGTGTACGKSAVAAGMIYRLQSRGIIAAGLNPAPGDGAERAAGPVSVDAVRDAFDELSRRADCVIVEGKGGWASPLGAGLTLADLARALDLPVVLVVRLRRGCVDQAMASARSIRDDGLNLAGWIGNAVDADMERAGTNLVSLKGSLAPAPCLGVVDHHPTPTPEAIARHLRFDRLMTAMGADEGSDQAENQSR